MCRICGRTIKCIFDSMPSRTLIQHIPSRRAFTTAGAQPTRPPLASSRPKTSSSSALTASFSTLRLSPRTPKPTPTTLSHTGTLTTRTLLPLASASASASQTLTQLPTRRSFSTTPTLLGHRRRMDTFSPSRRVQKRRHGYLSRVRTKNGQKTLKNRRLRGRKDLSW